jgi:hypothetical protein
LVYQGRGGARKLAEYQFPVDGAADRGDRTLGALVSTDQGGVAAAKQARFQLGDERIQMRVDTAEILADIGVGDTG